MSKLFFLIRLSIRLLKLDRQLIAQSTSVIKIIFILGIHVHTPCTHSRLIYFKHVHKQTNMESKTNKV